MRSARTASRPRDEIGGRAPKGDENVGLLDWDAVRPVTRKRVVTVTSVILAI
jgi:hypothetical protein